jgi:hypothetical protein
MWSTGVPLGQLINSLIELLWPSHRLEQLAVIQQRLFLALCTERGPLKVFQL